MKTNEKHKVKVNVNLDPDSSIRAKKAEEVAITKELNVYGKSAIFIGYSLLIVLATVFLKDRSQNNNSMSDIYTVKKQQAAILSALEQNSKKEFTQNWYEASKQSIDTSVDAVKKTLSELREYDTYSREIIGLQNKKIRELQRVIEQQTFIKKRNIVSSESETIPYSQSNYDTLLYEHQLKVDRLKQKHELQEKAFTAVMDLNQPGVRDKWIKFVDEQKIELRKLKNDLQEKRREFKKKKYLTVTSN